MHLALISTNYQILSSAQSNQPFLDFKNSRIQKLCSMTVGKTFYKLAHIAQKLASNGELAAAFALNIRISSGGITASRKNNKCSGEQSEPDKTRSDILQQPRRILATL